MGPDGPGEQVQDVNALVHHDVAVLGFVEIPGDVAGQVAAVPNAMAHQNFADAAALNELLRRVAVRVVTQLKPDLEQVLGVLGCGDHGAALLGRDGQRLFRIQMLADFEDRDVEILVGVIGSGEHDGIDVFSFVEHPAEVGIRFRRSPAWATAAAAWLARSGMISAMATTCTPGTCNVCFRRYDPRFPTPIKAMRTM